MAESLSIVTYRGVKCISTMPEEIVWDKQIGIECLNCRFYGSYKSVLIGLCINCANHYNGFYGSGYYQYLEGLNVIDDPKTFGNLNTNDVKNKIDEIDEIDEIEQYKVSDIIHNEELQYSIFYLSILSIDDLKLLEKKGVDTNFENSGCWRDFKDYYNCDDEVLIIIINLILQLKKEYEDENILFNKEYYKKCIAIEKFYKVIPYKDISLINKNECSFCKIQKEKKQLKKCNGCKKAYYCSIACQIHDWKNTHKEDCKIYQNIID